MRTLIIPDVHEQHERVREILKGVECNQTVFLGDWFDSFQSTEASKRGTAKLLKEVAEIPTVTLLWGNHDVPYGTLHGPVCSGHKYSTKQIIKSVGVPWDRFKLVAEVGPWTLSHAGFRTEYEIRRAWQLQRTGYSLIIAPEDIYYFQVGWSRGGRADKGGPLWLDWNSEFESLDVPQIVGHTKHKAPEWKGADLCLDTDLNHVAILDDSVGTCEILQWQSEGVLSHLEIRNEKGEVL